MLRLYLCDITGTHYNTARHDTTRPTATRRNTTQRNTITIVITITSTIAITTTTTTTTATTTTIATISLTEPRAAGPAPRRLVVPLRDGREGVPGEAIYLV